MIKSHFRNNFENDKSDFDHSKSIPNICHTYIYMLVLLPIDNFFIVTNILNLF